MAAGAMFFFVSFVIGWSVGCLIWRLRRTFSSIVLMAVIVVLVVVVISGGWVGGWVVIIVMVWWELSRI